VSKARWGIVEDVGVVVLVLVPVVHEGYSVDCPHFHHYHHFHPHPHRQRPTSARFPNWEGIERLTTISEDSHNEECELPRSTGYGTLDFLPPKRWGMGAVPNRRSGHRPPFDQRLG